jgi:hypothetical protein
MSEQEKQAAGEEGENNFEMLAGVIIAFFAAILSINGLGGGKFGGDEAIANIDKGSQFSWLQSKSVKKTLTEAEAKDLERSLKAGSLPEAEKEAATKDLEKLKSKIERYEHEMKIIQEGPAKYKNEPWFAALDDEKIKNTTGAEEHEAKATGLNEAGDVFDYGELFLQLCLVLGAVSLVIKGDKMKRNFLIGMCACGVIGSIFTFVALSMAWPYL